MASYEWENEKPIRVTKRVGGNDGIIADIHSFLDIDLDSSKTSPFASHSILVLVWLLQENSSIRLCEELLTFMSMEHRSPKSFAQKGRT